MKHPAVSKSLKIQQKRDLLLDAFEKSLIGAHHSE